MLMSVKNPDGTDRFLPDEVTGMFISMMFAGHHTTSGTAAWTLIELLRHPDVMARVDEELAELYADGAEVSYQALRAMPLLESSVKEALRLHPPLILLLRVAKQELEVEGFAIHPGQMVAASPSVSNRLPGDFPEPDAFRPDRYLDPREEDRLNPWTWIPFGAGPPPLRRSGVRHDAAEGHLQRAAPRLGVRAGPAVRHLPQRPFQDGRAAPAALRGALPAAGGGPQPPGDRRLMRIVVDRDLCQGHGVCESEAPERVRGRQRPPGGRGGVDPARRAGAPSSKPPFATAPPMPCPWSTTEPSRADPITPQPVVRQPNPGNHKEQPHAVLPPQ